MNWQVITGDCLPTMAGFEPCSFDLCLCDPPYELGFMGKHWDASGVAFKPETWAEVLRVLKPGGSLVAFGGTRTSHRLVCAIEDAGFEIRDCLMWLYGSGFPKSLDISKAIDKAAGAEREVVGCNPNAIGRKGSNTGRVAGYAESEARGKSYESNSVVTSPATPLAQLWRGYGTALKPAYEPIVWAMRPLDKTFAHNAEVHGVAGLNVDGGRIGTGKDKTDGGCHGTSSHSGQVWSGNRPVDKTQGRFPANLILDEAAGKMLDEQSGELSGRGGPCNPLPTSGNHSTWDMGLRSVQHQDNHGGGASRFFLNTGRVCILCESSSTKAESKEACKTTSVRSAGRDLETIRATIGSIAAGRVPTEQVELLALRVPYAESLCDSCATAIALGLVAIKTSAFSGEELRHILDCILGCNASILLPSLVSFAGLWENIDTIPTTESLSLLCGSVLHAITSCTRETGRSGSTRFAYVSKASRAEREAGLEGMEPAQRDDSRKAGNPGGDNPRNRGVKSVLCTHPTVKPLALMRYLLTLFDTPTGGRVLDPFCGSGSTGVACAQLGRNFTGIDTSAEYCEIARKRIDAATRQQTLFTSDLDKKGNGSKL